MRFTEILTKKINRNGAIAHKRSFTHEKKCSIAPKPCNKKIEIAESCGIKKSQDIKFYRQLVAPPQKLTCCLCCYAVTNTHRFWAATNIHRLWIVMKKKLFPSRHSLNSVSAESKQRHNAFCVAQEILLAHCPTHCLNACIATNKY